jgi:5-methylcytosine-specific restriction endonuclease McrA
MRRIRPKQPRLKLQGDDYRKVHWLVLQRDGWRCQVCGAMRNLQVHHLQFRSRSGDDLETNLVTLCADRHRQAHETQ